MAADSKIKTYRWFFYISLAQFAAYFLVPALSFPRRYILSIEFISAISLGLVVALFLLVVNIYGLFIDKMRRSVYIGAIIFLCLWFLLAIICWSYIEYIVHILR